VAAADAAGGLRVSPDREVAPERLELHHEPAYRKIRPARTHVRVPGFGVRVRVPGQRLQRVLAVAVLALGLGVTAATTTGLVAARHQHGYVLDAAARPAPVPRGQWAAPPPEAAPPPVSPPVFLTIPAIGVRTRLIRLSLTRAGTLQPPRTTAVAGWYTGSPPPGAIGSAVIAGHVDSYRGPGVFFELRRVRPGMRVFVRQADGKLAVFAVTSVRQYPKARFPTSSVYGATPAPELRLITCGGTFDWARGSYLSNVVVYATMISGPTAG
jgi:Sortase domain